MRGVAVRRWVENIGRSVRYDTRPMLVGGERYHSRVITLLSMDNCNADYTDR